MADGTTTARLAVSPRSVVADAAPAATTAATTALGGTVGPGGATFNVWAPFAERVHVTGSFCDWANPGVALASSDAGVWHGWVRGAAANDQYQYRVARGAEEQLKNDPRVRAVDPDTRRGVLVDDRFDWGADDFRLPPVEQLVIYELHIGTFNGRGKAAGDFDSVRAKLPYLKALGINAIELLPPAEFPTELSWGYNTTNPFAVEARYGDADGLRRLVKAAHQQGIGIIVDVVYNHFGPDDLDLWRFDGWSVNDGGGIYFYNDWRAATPWGENRPDYGRGEVRQYLRDNALMWLRDFRVDGLRFDATNFIRAVRGHDGHDGGDLAEGWSLLQWINEEIAREFPGRLTLAEDLQRNEWLVKGVGAGGAGFGAQWDAAFVHPVRASVIAVEDEARNLESIWQAVAHRYDGRAFSRVIYSESHDEVANGKARLPTEIAPDNASDVFAQKRSTLAAAMVMTSPGIPMLFKGQEFLEQGWFRDDVDLDWSRLEAFHGIQRLYRDLIALRKNAAGTTRGLTGEHVARLVLDESARVLAIHRWRDGGAGDDVVVVFNLSAQDLPQYRLGLPRPGPWQVRLNSAWTGYSEDFADLPVIAAEAQGEPLHGQPCSGLVAVAAYAAVIFSQDR